MWSLVCLCTPTCGTGGFQRMFLSGAGVKPVVPVGLFLRSRSTPLGSSRSLTTRFFSCHPTWCTGTHANKVFSTSIQYQGPKTTKQWQCAVLTTVCWLTWMTSSPAWIFLVRSAGDWRETTNKETGDTRSKFKQTNTGCILVFNCLSHYANAKRD